MATTPNYNWPTPDDTDLVRDGAEAIRDLGDAIDTTVDTVEDKIDDFITEIDVLTTKGDLLTNDGDDYLRLPVGADGETLQADSTEPTGLKWVVAGAGGFEEIAGGTVTNTAQLNITGISGNDYVMLYLELYEWVGSSTNSTGGRMRINAVSTGNLYRTVSVAAVNEWNLGDSQIRSGAQAVFNCFIVNPTSRANSVTTMYNLGFGNNPAVVVPPVLNHHAARITGPVTSIQVFQNSENIGSLKYKLFGAQ